MKRRYRQLKQTYSEVRLACSDFILGVRPYKRRVPDSKALALADSSPDPYLQFTHTLEDDVRRTTPSPVAPLTLTTRGA